MRKVGCGSTDDVREEKGGKTVKGRGGGGLFFLSAFIFLGKRLLLVCGGLYTSLPSPLFPQKRTQREHDLIHTRKKRGRKVLLHQQQD